MTQQTKKEINWEKVGAWVSAIGLICVVSLRVAGRQMAQQQQEAIQQQQVLR